MPTTISGTEGVDQIKDGTIQTADFAAGVGPVLTKYYESPEQTITAAGLLTLAHGFGVKPKLITIALVCKVTEQNYVIGDEVDPTVIQFTQSAFNQGGVSLVPDATNINIRYGSQSTVFYVLNKTTGVVAGITNANWRLIVRAWA